MPSCTSQPEAAARSGAIPRVHASCSAINENQQPQHRVRVTMAARQSEIQPHARDDRLSARPPLPRLHDSAHTSPTAPTHRRRQAGRHALHTCIAHTVALHLPLVVPVVSVRIKPPAPCSALPAAISFESHTAPKAATSLTLSRPHVVPVLSNASLTNGTHMFDNGRFVLPWVICLRNLPHHAMDSEPRTSPFTLVRDDSCTAQAPNTLKLVPAITGGFEERRLVPIPSTADTHAPRLAR